MYQRFEQPDSDCITGPAGAILAQRIKQGKQYGESIQVLLQALEHESQPDAGASSAA